MGQDCERFIGMCLESVKDADVIIYCDGGSTDGTLKYLLEDAEPDIEIIENEYKQEDPMMNGKQRNFYLKYLKENYMNDWCLALDVDEVLEDFGIQKIKQNILQIKEPTILSPKIHHFIGDLGHEDATRDVHYVPHRLFKITKELTYPEIEHPVLQGPSKLGMIDLHIWHLRECLGVFETQKKHENNWSKSSIHSEGYLRWWHMAMLFGGFPKKPVYYGLIPTPIKKHFRI